MAVCHHPPIPKSPGKNWIERIPGGHIPKEIECVARALYHSPGRASGDKSKAYQMAVGVAEDWAAGRRKISKEKQAKYVAAVAKWQALRAASHARSGTKGATNMSRSGSGRVVVDLATARTLNDLEAR